MNKNWNVICKIPDTHVMWALALLDMDSDLGRKFMERFPEYFTEEDQAGPYPLSLMRETAFQIGRQKGYKHGDEHVVSFNGVPNGIPVQAFDKQGMSVEGGRIPKLPTEISPHARQGETVTWKGKRFVVLQNLEHHDELYIAPAELVHVD